MIKHLPQDGAVQRDLHGESAEWSITDHLMAAAVDHLAVANWMFQAVNTGEDDETPDPPQPIPRPGLKDDEDDENDGHGEHDGDGHGAGGPSRTNAETISPTALARFFG
ncbi:hypothetical protein [Streptomyces showdoensis]|nr:hypothetical protein [Streptomyces showdoensis]